MSMDDLTWRRSLFLASGLAALPLGIILFVIIPFMRNHSGMNRGPEWIFASVQLIILSTIFCFACLNKRESCFTRIMLVFSGIVSILTGLILALSVFDISDMPAFKNAVLIVSLADIITGIIALRACV